MKQAQQPLYPKLSSIYNKILQLASAIMLIIALMSLLLSTAEKNTDNLTKHFNYIAQQQLQQAITGNAVIYEQQNLNKIEKNALLQQYLDGLTKVNYVKQAHLYDATGLLLISSTAIKKDKAGNDTQAGKAKSINDLYGISPYQRNLSGRLRPFIKEIRNNKSPNYQLHGYLRFTIEPAHLTHDLAKANKDQEALQRLMLIIAGLVGFLLTRGLNRFSRRGYRLNTMTEKA